MYGFGSNNHVARQDGLYDGLAVIAGTAPASQVKVEKGLAIVADKEFELKPAEVADLSLPAACPLGKVKVFLNAAGAKDAAGNALARISINKAEADKKRAAVNGSTAVTEGRSLVLAELTTSAHSGTVTIGGTWAAGDTVTVTLDGTAVTTTLDATSAASVTAVATAVAAALNANTTVAGKVSVTSSAGVVTLTSKVADAYSLSAAKVSTAGTATASGANLSGGGITAIDNTAKFRMFASNYSTKNL